MVENSTVIDGAARPAVRLGAANPSGLLAGLRDRAARLPGYFEAFHSYGSPRLKYMGWLGVAAYFLFYFIRFTRSNHDADDALPLRAAVLVMFLGTALQDVWPARLQRHYLAWAYLTLLAGLPFYAVYTGLERGGGVPAISNCFLALSFLVLVVDWRNLIVMLLVGIGAAFLAFRLGSPDAPVPHELLAQVPAFLLIAIVGYVFKHATEQSDLQRKLHEQQLADERRLAALGDALAFMAHELNTPLATIRAAVSVLHALRPGPAPAGSLPEGGQSDTASMLDRADRAAIYCQSLVTSFVQSARAVATNSGSFDGTARGLLDALLSEYPFAEPERAWVTARIDQDFGIPGRRDLVYLVLCTVVNNALHAMRGASRPRLEIVASVEDPTSQVGARRGWISVSDSGCGIPEPVLATLSSEPFSTKAGEGGTGMGLVFCRRVMESLGGSVTIRSRLGEGTTVLLAFDPDRAPA